MKRFKGWVYECEFCGKRNRSGGHMAKHEKHCTANPDRECRMCKVAAYVGDRDPSETTLAERIEALRSGGVGSLQDACNDCPACMLSAITLSGLNRYEEDGEGLPVQFNYKQAKEELFKEYNDGKAQDDYCYC